MKIVVRTLFQQVVTGNSDRVMAALWIPSGGKLIGATVNVHAFVHGVAEATGGMYGTNAFLLPVDDPDAVVTADSVWDRHVPKDINEAAGAFDLDTGTAEGAAEFSIGEPDIAAVLGVGPSELQGGRRRKLLTFANSARAFDSTAATYTMADGFTLNIGGGERVEKPSVMCVGFSSPSIDETTTVFTSPAEDQWTNLQFPAWTLEQALVELLGQVETGAESPWEEASAFLLTFIEPLAVLTAAGSVLERAWVVFAQAVMVMEVPGRPMMQLDSEQ